MQGTMSESGGGGVVIGGRYRLGRKLGQGSFGKCYAATDQRGGPEVAVKLEPAQTKNPQLLGEAQVIQFLVGGLGVPEVYWSGTEGAHNAMAVEILGSSVEDLFHAQNRRFSIHSVLMLGDQMLNRLEYVHSHGLLHRDVKPDNFVMGLGRTAALVYIIDFGLAKRYRNPKTLRHNPWSDRCTLTGTPRYASINNHLGLEQSRRDDLESLAYVLLYLARGGLHWQGIKANSKKEKYQMILEKKLSLPVDVMVGPAPEELGTFLEYCRALSYEAQPDYSFLSQLLRGALQRLNLPYDLKFGWMAGASRRPGGSRSRRGTVTSSRMADAGEAERPAQ